MNKGSALTRRSLSILFAIVLIFSSVVPVIAADPIQTDAVFTVGNVNANSGDTGILVPVTVKDSPNFVGLGLQFTFPDELFLVDILRGDDLVGGNIAKNPTGGLVNFDWDEAAFPDGEIYVLKFDISEYAQDGDYIIDIALSSAGWANNEPRDLLPLAMNSGKITVTGQNVAKIADISYISLNDAVDAAINAEVPTTITMIGNALVADVEDRIVIPSGANITLDMNSHSITSELMGDPAKPDNRRPVTDRVLDKALIEVKAGGKLNIVDNSSNMDGSFIHSTGDLYTVFLINSGTLNMENVAVNNFYDGIRDGSYYSGGSSGTYETIADCTFTATETTGVVNYQKTGINIGSGQAEMIDSCVFNGYEEKGARAVDVGGLLDQFSNNDITGMVYIRGTGTVNNFINNTITHEPEDDDFAYALDIWGGNVGTLEGNHIKSSYYGIHIMIGSQIDEIKSGKYEGRTTGIENSGRILEISGGEFYSSWDGYGFENGGHGVIDLISGGEFNAAWYVGIRNEGQIIEINDGQFLPGNYGKAFINSGGTINSISGGTFGGGSGYALFNDNSFWGDSIIESITGGLFVSNDGYALQVGGYPDKGYSEISEISGGTFISSNSSALCVASLKNVESLNPYQTEPNGDSKVGEIKGGLFIGRSEAAIRLCTGTIEKISDGIFIGNNSVLKFDGISNDYIGYDPDTWDDVYEDVEHDNSVIENIQGGYYKSLTDSEIVEILSEGASWSSDDGYDFATVPLRAGDLPVDFPDEEVIEERDGFYHFGKTVDVTWKVEGEDDIEDLFVKNDPIYFYHDEPELPGHSFLGWDDGQTFYGPNDPMPNATQSINYGAEFLVHGSEHDYEVSLELPTEQSNNINIGEEISVEITVSTIDNNRLYGATIPISYDSSKFDFISASYGSLEGLGINTGENDVVTVVGFNGDGWAIEGEQLTLGTLKFKVKSDIETGQTTLKVVDPIIDQKDAVQSIVVAAGEDLALNLYNLQVTFTAGTGVTMDNKVAYVKYNAAGLYTDTTYGTVFAEPTATANAHHDLDEPLWKPAEGENVDFSEIATTKFTANATYTATASPKEYPFTYIDGELEEITGLTAEGKATYGADITFKVKEKPGYTIKRVAYVQELSPVYEVDWAITEDADADGVYTVPGNQITCPITIEVRYEVTGEFKFTSNTEFNSLPDGYKLLLYTTPNKLVDGAYEYDGNVMFYSSAYSKPEENEYVYLYVVENSVKIEESPYSGKKGVIDLVQINPDSTNIDLSYNKDVNLDGKRNSTDPVLTYGLYSGEHLYKPFLLIKSNLDDVTIQMRLEADVNGDGTVNTSDATIVRNALWDQ